MFKIIMAMGRILSKFRNSCHEVQQELHNHAEIMALCASIVLGRPIVGTIATDVILGLVVHGEWKVGGIR